MARTASQDANAGTTHLKERKESVAQFQGNFAVSQEKSALDAFADGAQAAQSALSAVGSATSSSPTDAAMMQGAQEGVDEAIKANKRSGFAKFFFGEDAGYATAVEQATKNFANNEYIRQAQEMEQNISLTPEEYAKRMDAVVSERIRETYADDKDAQNTAMRTWLSQSHKLSREHAAKHMAFSQEQAFAEGVRDLTSQFDIIHLNSAQGTTMDGQIEAQEELEELLSPNFIYTAEDGKAATPLASRNMQVKAIENQLAAGNTAVLQGLPDNFEDGLTTQQMTRLQRAKQSYDLAISKESEVIVEEGLLLAAEGNIQGLNAQIQRLTAIHPRLSGTPNSLDKFNEDKIRLQRSLNAAINKGAKQQVKEQNLKNYYLARESGDAGAAGASYSKAAEEGADDLVVANAAIRVATQLDLPMPESTADVLNLALSNKSAMNSIALKAQNYGTISPSLAEAAKQSIMNLRGDEQGFLTEEEQTKIGNLRVLYDKAPGAMRKALGPDGSAMIEITLNNSFEPVKEISNKRSEYIKNKNITLSKQELNIPPEMTMTDYVKQALGNQSLDSAALSHYAEQLKTGYRIYGGDTKAATNYMKQQYKVNNTNWRGKNITNGGLIETDVRNALNKLEDTGMGKALIESRIPLSVQDPANPFKGFGDLNDVQFEVNPSTQDMVISSSQFSYPIVLPATTLQTLANKAESDKKREDELRAQANMAIFKQEAKENPQSQYWPTPTEVNRKRTQFWPTPKE